MPAASLQAHARPARRQSNWEAALQLQFDRRDGRTVLRARRGCGPLVVQKPLYPEGGGVCHIYLIHPPGGVVGGDRLRLEMALQARAHVLLTTPGATKFYRSAGDTAVLRQRLEVGDGAALEWLPQDGILFSGSRVNVETTVQLAARARFIGWDIICLGRPASGDAYGAGEFNQRCQILRGTEPLLIERNHYLPELPGRGLLRARWGLAGHTVVATLYALPASAETLALLRDRLPPRAGLRFAATRVGDVLVLRCLGHRAEQCRDLLVQAWGLLRQSILQRAACAPRIWNT